jgi:hypothetical protein
VDIAVKDWEIQPVGGHFRITFSLVNMSGAALEGGMPFTVMHTAVDPGGYKDPSSLAPPASMRSLMGAETVARGELPALRPGERTAVEAYAQGFGKDANHILTVIFHDGGQVRLEPQPQPWYWLRILSPRARPGALQFNRASVEPVSSFVKGYQASHVRIILQNVSLDVLEAGTPISLIHGNSDSAGGYWGPDDFVDPNDPGNPYASFFREELFQGRLERPLYPGELIEVEGVANVPEGFPSLQQMTVSVGE